MADYESLPDGPEREADLVAFNAIMSQTNWAKEFGRTYEESSIALCKYIDTHSHWLRARDGFVYMKSHYNDIKYKVLLTNRPDMVGKNRSVIVINQTRWPESDEPSFPNGETLNMTDIVISSDKIGLAQETQYKNDVRTEWNIPETTTLLSINKGSLRGYGNLRRKKGHSPRLRPINYKYLDNNLLLTSSAILENTLHVLRLFHENDIEPLIRGFSN